MVEVVWPENTYARLSYTPDAWTVCPLARKKPALNGAKTLRVPVPVVLRLVPSSAAAVQVASKLASCPAGGSGPYAVSNRLVADGCATRSEVT